MMDRFFWIIVLTLAILQAAKANNSPCAGKDYFDPCGETKLCVCPSLLIVTVTNNSPVSFSNYYALCKRHQMVCREWPCWNNFDAGVPQQPLIGPGGVTIRCNNNDDCNGGAKHYCTPENYCCVDTPIYEPSK